MSTTCRCRSTRCTSSPRPSCSRWLRRPDPGGTSLSTIDLHEVHEIEQLKYRYLRHLDLKEWDALGETLTEDCQAAYAGGDHSYDGRDAILGFLRSNLGMATRFTVHMVHHPEITFDSSTEATGKWMLQDVVIDTDLGFTLRGASHYEDRYRKESDGWR